ncbi:unnamed protein product [Sphagnum troendelagicum]|uniref:protein-S-isoprenylcysteine alpha-carbonyl methylesterase n=1 Tax=Sphagnum jensenii TaxID=128206 RepID=A0ABP0W993_9BRYO
MGTAHAIHLGAVGPAVCCTVHNDKPWHLMRQEYIKNGMMRQAVKGAIMEVYAARGMSQRARVATALVVIILREVVGSLKLVPYGLYAHNLYLSLVPFGLPSSTVVAQHMKLSGAKGLKRGSQNILQSWLRPRTHNVSIARNVRYGDGERNLMDIYVPGGPVQGGSKPVIMFVHGGVWASGDKWQFSPLGSQLAQDGVIAVVVQYTLFPQVLAADQVSEVSQALTWTMDNIQNYGGHPRKIYVMGHSSGSHLCAMLLWERARCRTEMSQGWTVEQQDARIPHGFIGLAGVYDIAEHYKYETQRGVNALSCMKPAMGGEKGFYSMSPTLLFMSLFKDLKTDDAAKFLVEGTDLVPTTCVIFTSDSDIVVPPDSSFALHRVLTTAGCNSRVIKHNALRHEDFVIWYDGWGNVKPDIGTYFQDIIDYVRDEIPVGISSLLEY